MTTYQYEVWPPKGDRALCLFTTAGEAFAFADERSHVVPGLRVEIVTVITRRALAERPGRLRSIAA